jgi:hypothetical protein
MTQARVVVAIVVVMAGTAAAQAQPPAPRFFPDDPLHDEPVPIAVDALEPRALSDVLERVNNTFKTTGQRHPENGVIPAGGVNSMGEVMDGDWYVNRHWTRRMTLDELRRGPGDAAAPDTRESWRVLVVKPFGINPGVLIADAKNDLYLLRFDPLNYEGLATGAEMVTSRFLHALGYHVTENYLVRFNRSQLVVHQEGQAVSSAGKTRRLIVSDIDGFLRRVPQGEAPEGGRKYRAVATRLPDRRESLLGPFQFWGTRSDDPNDVVLHEHRRELRGLFVFSAWLNNSEANALGTQDVLQTINGTRRIRHYFADFTKSLGSGLLGGQKRPWEGNEPFFPGVGGIARNIASFGVRTPAWMKAKYPGLPEVGAFEGQTFDPATWSSSQPIPPFENRLPDDTFWAARQVMAFTDEEIRAIVQTGGYSRAAEDWITAALIERRNRIGRTFFARVLPLDRFRLNGSALEFDDLSAVYGLSASRPYTIDWYRFDNDRDTILDTIGTGAVVPPGVAAIPIGGYAAARLYADDAEMNVTVYVRRRADGADIVGLDRGWPGKVIAPPLPPVRLNRRVFADLTTRQQELFKTYIDSYNATRGSQYSPEQGFDRLTVSEQTTFYGVTHALSNTTLTDARGGSLGSGLDRVESIERIAGQYAGRGGDQQFRLYVNLKPDTREVLDNSREFFRDHENTVYHVGYPHSYRQIGKEPNLQMSLAEDGLRADIDVDYRSSRSPQGLFNGHLTSANSDIRVGENATLHRGRWGGLIAWWQETFGRVEEPETDSRDLIDSHRPETAAPLPPDRPSGANPARIEDAAQEFLSDWLVRKQYQQALEFLSPRAYACLVVSDGQRGQALDSAGARRELLTLMEHASDKLGPRSNLTGTIVAFVPRDPKRVVVEHPFRNEFLLTPLTDAEARPYFCDKTSTPSSGAEYFGVAFQFRVSGGGVLGLLWTREGSQWKLVSYQPLVP